MTKHFDFFNFFGEGLSISELSESSYLTGLRLLLHFSISVSPAAVSIALSSSALILALRAFT